MTDYKIGYGKPPKDRRFKAGVSGNPKGRPKRGATPLTDLINNAFRELLKYRESGKLKEATACELIVKTIVDQAVGGDIDAAELVLGILQRAERLGDKAVDQIVVRDWLPDYPGQTAERKTADAAMGRDAEPRESWPLPED